MGLCDKPVANPNLQTGGGGGDVSKKIFFGALGPRAKGKEKIFSLPSACRLFSRGVIFTRARVSLALLSLRKNGGTNRSLLRASVWFKNKGGGAGPGPAGLSPRSALQTSCIPLDLCF